MREKQKEPEFLSAFQFSFAVKSFGLFFIGLNGLILRRSTAFFSNVRVVGGQWGHLITSFF